jgi:hypothetical protein
MFIHKKLHFYKVSIFVVFHIPAEERKGVNVEGFGGGEAHKKYVYLGYTTICFVQDALTCRILLR